MPETAVTCAFPPIGYGRALALSGRAFAHRLATEADSNPTVVPIMKSFPSNVNSGMRLREGAFDGSMPGGVA
jgi:hypothetical protein